MNEQVIVIGLDGAPWSLIHTWINEDKLPTFKKISEEGFIGKLKSTVPSTTFPAVPSLLTGMNPANLGVFSFFKADNSPLTLWDIDHKKIWTTLSEQGQTSCVMNIPLTYPPQKINGVMVSGWSPSDREIYTYPDDVKEEIIGFHDDDITKQVFQLRDKKNIEKSRKELLSVLVDIIKKRYDSFKIIYDKNEYNFGILWIYHTDFLQHCCWEFKDLLLELYLQIDEILNDLLLNYPDKNIIILSDHGFESRPSRYFSVNTWLYENNYLQKQSGLINYFAVIAQHIAYNYLPRRVVTKIIKLWQPKKSELDQEFFIEKIDNFPGIDQKNSKAYLSTLFGISINKNDAYDKIRVDIIKKLMQLKDEENKYVVREIQNREDVYKGKYLDKIPDIILLTSEKYVPFPALTKKLYGALNRKGYWWQTGEHYRNRDGIILGRGPYFKNKIKLNNAEIEDVYPTILYLLNCSIPSYCDGNVLTNITIKDDEPKYMLDSEEKAKKSYTSKELDDEDEKIIMERLKKLGYIE
jgi:predicted AlkP superfamily phosphohydrolase/phosphomutase